MERIERSMRNSKLPTEPILTLIKESNWFYSEFDGEYYENILEVVSYMKWDKQWKCYVEETIYMGTLINLIRNEVFHVYEGEVYNMLCHGKPLTLAA